MTRAVRVAAMLWVVLGVTVWNVVFDRLLVLAGRRYSHAAAVSFQRDGVYLQIDDWMRAATQRAIVVASVAGLTTVAAGLVAVTLAARRDRRRRHFAPRTRIW